MAITKMWPVVVMVVGLLAMSQHSMSLRNPIYMLPEDIVSDDGPTLGLITTSIKAEKALNESGFFSPTSSVTLQGRTFMIAEIYGIKIVYVRSSSYPAVHVGITMQIMGTNFPNVRGIVHFGTAGALYKSLKIGTVVVANSIAFTGNLQWQDKDASETGQLVFRNFNVNPSNGDNLLGSILYNEMDVYYKGKIYSGLWFYPTKKYQRYASKIKIDSGEVVVGLNTSCSDIYVDNPAYAHFLHRTFGVSTAETSSVAVGLAARINSMAFISLQGVSNHADGMSTSTSNSELANNNVVKAVIGFISQASAATPAHEDEDDVLL